jgi:hypothetical protein
LATNLVVAGIGIVKGSMHNRLHRVKLVQNAFALVQSLTCAVKVVQQQLYPGDSNRRIHQSVLRVLVVHLLRHRFEEREPLLFVGNLISSRQREFDELELVDFVGKFEDEDLVEGQSLRRAARVGKEFEEDLGELVVELALPVVVAIQDETLEVLGGYLPLLGEEVIEVGGAHLGGR